MSWALAGVVARRVPWVAWAITVVVAGAVVTWRGDEDPTGFVRAALVVVAAVVATALDDPAEGLTETAPVGRAARRRVAVAWAVAAAAAGWLVLVALSTSPAALLIEQLALVVAGTAMVAMAVEVRRPAGLGSAALILGAFGSRHLPVVADRLWERPPAWWWLAVLGAGCAITAGLSRERT